MNTLDLNTAMEEQQDLEEKKVREAETITSQDVCELYDPEPEFLRAKTLTLEEAAAMAGGESAWDLKEPPKSPKTTPKITLEEGSNEVGASSKDIHAVETPKVQEVPVLEAPKKVDPSPALETAKGATEIPSESKTFDPPAARPEILESVTPLAPTEQRIPARRGRKPKKGKEAVDHDKTSSKDDLGKTSNQPKGKKGSTKASVEPSGSSAKTPDTSGTKRKRVAEKKVVPEKPKKKDGDGKTKTKKSPEKPTKPTRKRPEKDNKKDADESKDEDDKKAKASKASRKSSAYHVAKRQALKDGKTPAEANEIAKLAP